MIQFDIFTDRWQLLDENGDLIFESCYCAEVYDMQAQQLGLAV